MTSCYYLEENRVSKEDYTYCPLIDKNRWNFENIDGNEKIKTVLIYSVPDTTIVENPETQELEMRILQIAFTCEEFFNLFKNDTTKIINK